MKSEPDEYSIDDLRDAGGRGAPWDGVRNYQARNFLRDKIKPGDGVLFYHSSCETPGIAGEAVVARGGYPDPTAFDPKSKYFDPKSAPEKPARPNDTERSGAAWYAVDVRFVRACRTVITLDRLRRIPALKNMLVLRRGQRLSVQPVTAAEWAVVIQLPEWT